MVAMMRKNKGHDVRTTIVQPWGGWPSFEGANCATPMGIKIMDAARENRMGRAAARQLCEGCPLMFGACLESLAMEKPAGRWGGVVAGMDVNERRALRRARAS